MRHLTKAKIKQALADGKKGKIQTTAEACCPSCTALVNIIIKETTERSHPTDPVIHTH